MHLFRKHRGRSSIQRNTSQIKALAFLVYSNIWVSLCAAGFTYGISALFNVASIHEFVFCATLFVYNGQRYYKIRFTNLIFETHRIYWMKSNSAIVKVLILFGFFGVVFWGLPLLVASKFNFMLIALSAILSVLYVVRLGGKNLREVPGLKVFIITIVYFIITCLLPFQTGTGFCSEMRLHAGPFITLLLSQYLYILGITILFDIPDINHDAKSMKTIAQKVGTKRTVLFSIILLLPLICFMLFEGTDTLYFWLFALLHLPFYYFLLKRETDQYYLPFFGEMLLLINGLVYFALRYY